MTDDYRIIVVNDAASLREHIDDWQDLANRSLDDNIYLTPEFLLPVLQFSDTDNEVYVVLAYRVIDQQARLMGLAAFSAVSASWRIPCRMLSTAVSRHTYLSTPLLDREQAGPAWQAIWHWLDDRRHNWGIINLQKMTRESPTWELLDAEFHSRKRDLCKTVLYERPVLQRYQSFDDYLAALPRKRRQEYGRLSRKLAGQGKVEVKLHNGNDDPQGMAQRFMQLENKSWKGTSGSAMQNTQGDARFFTQLLSNFAADNRIYMIELHLDGQPIAMSCNFVMGNTLFAFKVAYDPDYREYSPGILTEFEGVRLFLDDPELKYADSGANGDSYIKNYWLGKSTIMNNYVATSGLFSLMCLSYLKTGIFMKNWLSNIMLSARA